MHDAAGASGVSVSAVPGRRRLAEDAEREEIEGQARESAQRTLENMLKMLKSEVQTVRILPAAEFERQKNVRPDSGQAAISDR